MRISLTFGPYSHQDYGKPWIAVVTAWPVDSGPAIRWGNYVGDNTGGEVEIEASAGDIVRWGQKHLQVKGLGSHWGVVKDDGSISECTGPAARQIWDETSAAREKNNPLAVFSDEALIAEVRRRGIRF
jgi:hypothetical protein